MCDVLLAKSEIFHSKKIGKFHNLTSWGTSKHHSNFEKEITFFLLPREQVLATVMFWFRNFHVFHSTLLHSILLRWWIVTHSIRLFVITMGSLSSTIANFLRKMGTPSAPTQLNSRSRPWSDRYFAVEICKKALKLENRIPTSKIQSCRSRVIAKWNLLWMWLILAPDGVVWATKRQNPQARLDCERYYERIKRRQKEAATSS